MRRTLTRRSFVGGAIATAVTVVGCQKQSPQAGTQPQAGGRNSVVNLYSARHYDSDQAIYQQFTQKTGIQVNLIEAEADALIERLKSEGTNSPADVLITVDAGRLWRAEQAGMFQPIDSAALKQVIPAHLHHPNNLWFGFSKRARPILYNKDQVDPTELSTYEDLANEKWRGQILIRSSTNVYNQSLVGSLIAANGLAETEAWARGLVANFARPPEGNDTAQILACAAGAGKLAIANTYYLVRMAKSTQAEEKAAAAKIGVFYPNQSDRGTHVNISGGGIVKTSPNPEAALKFLNFLASPEAQDIFAKSNNEYSVIKGVALDATLASYGEFKEDVLNAAVYGEKGEAALQLMDRANWT